MWIGLDMWVNAKYEVFCFDAGIVSRVLDQACKSDALLETFSSQLVAEIKLPGSVCGNGWLQGEAVKIGKLVELCLAKVAKDHSYADTYIADKNTASASTMASSSCMHAAATLQSDISWQVF